MCEVFFFTGNIMGYFAHAQTEYKASFQGGDPWDKSTGVGIIVSVVGICTVLLFCRMIHHLFHPACCRIILTEQKVYVLDDVPFALATG